MKFRGTRYVASHAVFNAIVGLLNKKLIERWDSEHELFYDIAHVGPTSKCKQVKYAVELW